MLQFLASYLKVLVALLMGMGVYCLTIVPAIEPTNKRDKAQHVALPPPLPTSHWWQEFFEAEDWQRNSPKIIITKQGILVSKTWEQLDDKTWKLKPLTLIMPQSSRDQSSVFDASNLDLSSRDIKERNVDRQCGRRSNNPL